MLLKKGSRGFKVRQLQKLLRIPQDGEFGDITYNAVRAYQQRSGLSPDGIVGAKTWMKLMQNRASDVYRDNLAHISPVHIDSGNIHSIVHPLMGTLFSNNPRNEDLFEEGLKLFIKFDLFTYFKLDTKHRLMHFLAQIREETGRNITLIENMNYRCSVLPKLFSYYRKKRSAARSDGRCEGHAANQRNIARKAYGGRMGNAPYPSMDGWDRRGRGSKMTTGTHNYRALNNHIKKNLPELYKRFRPFEDPDQVSYSKYWLISGAVFWLENELYKHADKGCDGVHVDAVTKIVNKHTGSYASRKNHMKTLQRIYV